MSRNKVATTPESFRVMIGVLVSAVLMVVLLLLWAQSAEVGHTIINDHITSKETVGNRTTYVLNVADIENIEENSLHFKSYGNAIIVKADECEIYAYGQEYAAENKDIGRIYVTAYIPKDTKTLTIELTASDGTAHPDLAKIDLCRVEDSSRYYLANDTLGFPMALIFIVLGVFAVMVAIVVSASARIRWALATFGLTLTGMSVELADTGGHYLVLFQNQHVWNIIFYFACFILPVAALSYMFILLGDRFPKKHRRIALVPVLICAIYGILEWTVPMFTSLRFSDFHRWYTYIMIICVISGFYTIIYMIFHKAVSRTMLPFFMGMFVWGVVAILLSYAKIPTINTSNVTRLDVESIEAIFLLSILIVTLRNFLHKEFENIQAQRLRVMQLEHELQDMRYKVFASQMQPHFLYNALSSIRQIIYEDPKYAADMVEDFTTHLRASIRALSSENPISFGLELRNIEAYVRIEQMRFGDKLKMEYDIRTDDFEVIPLSIQPLVENAIRHGIYERGDDGGHVLLRTSEAEANWIVEVIDDGVGFDVDAILSEVDKEKRDSIGLKNLRMRLENLLQATVDIQSVVGEGTHVTVSIPKEK